MREKSATSHAVFDTETRQRVSDWLTFADATTLYTARFTRDRYVVRSQGDPKYAEWPRKGEGRLPYVKLSRDQRLDLLDVGRAAGDLESAKDAMLDALCRDARFEELEAEELSDYAWAAAKFCFPREWKEFHAY